MRPKVVIKPNPVANDPTGMLQGFESIAMRTLLFQCSNHSFNHAVLFWCIGCDEFLKKAIASDEGRIAAAGKNQPIVTP